MDCVKDDVLRSISGLIPEHWYFEKIRHILPIPKKKKGKRKRDGDGKILLLFFNLFIKPLRAFKYLW